MAKEKTGILKICDWIVRYSIYAVLFLMPIFFLPWTSDALDFNKQALLILLGSVAMFCWMLKTLVSGKLEIRNSKVHLFAGALFLVYILATVFSANRYGSFWGWPQITSESLLSMGSILVFYFLISNTFTEKNLSTSVIILSISAMVAEIVGALQLFGIFIIPFSFAKSISFNTIGSVGSLGFFIAILLPIIITMLIYSKKWWRIFFAVELAISAVLLFVINYPVIWWSIIISLAALIIFGMIKRNFFDGRWMAIPVFFLAVSVFSILLNLQIPNISQKANEVFLSQGASYNMALQAVKQRPFLGSGPGTFSFDFLKFKDPVFSQGALWNATFSQASSKVLTDLASTGVLGLVALLALLGCAIFCTVKSLALEKRISVDSKNSRILTLGLLSALVAETAAYFLYNSNILLNFILFFLVAGLVVLVSQDKREYELKPSSVLTLCVTFGFTVIFIFGLGILVLTGQKYTAEVNYYSGISSWQAGKGEAGTKYLEAAAGLNPSSDIYFTQLSQAYLAQLQAEIQNNAKAGDKTAPSDAEKSKIQALVANSVNAAKIATNLNPKSASDWSNLGYVYQSLYGLLGDSTTWALSSYETALKLDPNDPYLFYQEGNVNIVSVSALGQDKADQRNQFLSTAKEKLQKAIALNPSYSDALYSLGLVYNAMGDKTNAIKEITLVGQLNPKDVNIQKVLDSLNAGQAVSQTPAPVKSVPPGSEIKTSK